MPRTGHLSLPRCQPPLCGAQRAWVVQAAVVPALPATWAGTHPADTDLGLGHTGKRSVCVRQDWGLRVSSAGMAPEEAQCSRYPKGQRYQRGAGAPEVSDSS